MPKDLVHMGYMSKAVTLMSDQQLEQLLLKARDRNNKYNITGMLLYADGSFLQVIEGDSKSVKNIFTIIEKDLKHSAIKILFKEPIPQRNFTQWSMGFRRLLNEDIEAIEGMNHFLHGSSTLDEYLSSNQQASTLLKNIFDYFKRVA